VRVAVGDIRVFFEVYGPEWQLDEEGIRRRHVLIGLHGGPGLDGTKLRYQLAPLADVVQVVVPDQRGHGRSDLATPETWNLASWAADVRGLSDAFDIQHPIVFGTSFGGFVAQRYASAFPDHPAALILASTSPRLPNLDELLLRFHELGGEKAAEAMRRDWEEASEESGAEWMRVCGPLLSLNDSPDPGVVRAQAERIQTMQVNLHFIRGEGKTMDLRSALRNVRCPTLLMLGEHDPLVPLHLGEELVAAVPDRLARLEIIPNASHEVVTDNPEDTYRCIRDFIAELA
jgi:pimeloyl-ACP methyl ester carboxylesterase